MRLVILAAVMVLSASTAFAFGTTELLTKGKIIAVTDNLIWVSYKEELYFCTNAYGKVGCSKKESHEIK